MSHRYIAVVLFAGLLLLAGGTSAYSYNILALDMGSYWTRDLGDLHFGAQQGYGAPGAQGERWYTMVNYADLASVNLMAYDVLLVQSGFLDDWVEVPARGALNSLVQKRHDIRDFVAAGRGLVAWTEPFPNSWGWQWEWTPAYVESRGVYHENLVEIADPDHPALKNSTDESLSDWHSSWHGYFENYDDRLNAIARTGDYGPGDERTHRALTLAGAYNENGTGRMLYSMQDADYHSYQGLDGARTFMRDALDWAAFAQPVPEPSTWILALSGLLATGLFRLRSRRRGTEDRETRL